MGLEVLHLWSHTQWMWNILLNRTCILCLCGDSAFIVFTDYPL